ncbi:MAG: hypothetical protein ACQZ3M_02890 [cyanobacterium endosymbiont of Rhopalodia fuxianensis]
MIEIDYNAKQQISETIIHLPEKTSQIKFNSSGVVRRCSQGLTSRTGSSFGLNAETTSQM